MSKEEQEGQSVRQLRINLGANEVMSDLYCLLAERNENKSLG
jgi:hypothetical protein